MSEPSLADRRATAVSRVRRLFPGRPGGRWPATWRQWAADACLAAVLAFAEICGSLAAGAAARHVHSTPPPGTMAYVLLAVGCGALLVRRRYPVSVLAVVLATTLWAGALGARLIWFGLIAAFFTALLARQRAAAVVSLLIGYFSAVWPPWRIGRPGGASVGFALGLAAGLMFLLIVAELVRLQSQRSSALRRGREEERRRMASEERMRMARDLHDLVAHNISVINVQANTALHLMDRQPDRARTALTTINEVSRQALVELRAVLGVLRDVDGTAPLAPTPGLARLGDLVDNATAAGLAVRVDTDGDPAPLPADIDLAAYRIIQEALTNAARHSGSTAARVRLCYADSALQVEVNDDGRPGSGQNGHAQGSGNGIAGMTERAAALGGTLEAGHRPGGGFRVRARLPLPAGPHGAAS
jgi:signal transduction histidine kinase